MVDAFLTAAERAGSGEVYVAAALMGVGIGLSFAALANLIVEAVRPDETGVATGMNTVMRSIGGSIGSQLGAGLLTATIVAGEPTEHGFTLAFAVAAGALAISFLSALVVPRPRGAARTLAPETAAV